jgi:hypothetical protein
MYLGADGNGISNTHLGVAFEIGCGTVELYRARATKAFLSLRPSVVQWPCQADRAAISRRLAGKDGSGCFTDCVGLIDGTLFPLDRKPELNGEDYFSRKGSYSVAAQVVCDDHGRILDLNLGNIRILANYFVLGCKN